MSLWEKIEKRGREELNLDDNWMLYAVDLDGTMYGYADIKFAIRENDINFNFNHTISGSVKYLDLRDQVEGGIYFAKI